MVCLLLLLLPLLRVSAATPEPCELDELDEDDFRCVCNFTDPKPDWSSALQCFGAVEVEIGGGGRSLEQFLKSADVDSKQYADMIRALRLQRLTLGAAQVPAQLLVAFLRALVYSRLKELTLEDLEVTGPMPPPTPPQEATGPALSTLSLRNVSWATGGAWLGELQQWLKPGLRVLKIAQAHSLAFPCAQLPAFPALTTLDLSDNPGLGERGLTAALCPHKFPAVQDLALRNAGMETPSGVCTALAAASVQAHSLDLSHNSLRATAPGATGCVWPSALSSLNLSFAGLEQVPKGLPPKLSVLDLSCNRLSRAPRPDELPEVNNLILNGNPFMDPEALKHQEDPMSSGVVPVCASSALTMGVSGILALLQGARDFA
ncbi:monocyte differentiation antigen CD14 [Hippopotamus amphibius kiboko]|uniref:monocyte differentiation antigen CD14 n=1 Tax=Hippopotamus amphibius kiboko TaxID=575201 RepID=UPI0025920207|nr:monocyte differentiation antigen CD14 [Hippopotamus amphibius kiboko]